MNRRSGIPLVCPACTAELYPNSYLRPRPGLPVLGKSLVAAGCLLSAAMFIAGMAWFYFLRVEENGLPGKVMGLVTLFPSLVPGLLLGWIAYRLPKSVTLCCGRCRWTESYRVGRDGIAEPMSAFPMVAPAPPASASLHVNAVFNQIDPAPVMPSPPPAATASQNRFTVVDDDASQRDAIAWAQSELNEGREAESLVGDLVACGWDTDLAEHVVECGRRELRQFSLRRQLRDGERQ